MRGGRSTAPKKEAYVFLCTAMFTHVRANLWEHFAEKRVLLRHFLYLMYTFVVMYKGEQNRGARSIQIYSKTPYVAPLIR